MFNALDMKSLRLLRPLIRPINHCQGGSVALEGLNAIGKKKCSWSYGTECKIFMNVYNFFPQTYTSGSSRNSATTRLTFYNHTECECRDRMDDIMPRDMSSSVSLKTGGAPAAGVPMGQNNLDPLSAYQYHSGDHKTRNPQ